MVANRYEILALLGEGGMGAVYKAHDRELGHAVALKTVRAEFARNTEMLQRFKQEVILAREITHPNVVRIYDISEDAGMKFITMEFIDGEDLHSLLEQRGKFSPQDAVEVMRQVCSALEAAHKKGVIHRDLKPQNIMRDQQGRVVVMDFGLARGLDADGMTQTGALVGTMAYMSPEQALGEKLDLRSDLFAAGLIFFELLTGNVPYRAESALASLLKRSQAPAARASDVDATVPVTLSNVVSKCLERDRVQRYQSAAEIVHDLDGWQYTGGNAKPMPGRAAVLPKRIVLSRRWIGVGAALLAVISLVVGGIAVRHRALQSATNAPAVSAPIVSVAILPFRNASGDPQIDWMGASVAEMLGTDIGQSAQVRTVSAERIHQILKDLHIGPDSPLDADVLARVASFVNADVVVSGSYLKLGDHMRVDTSVRDLKHERTVSLKTEASEAELLSAVDTLAKSVRENLSIPPEVAREMSATAFKPASKSLDALRAYNEGIELTRQGKAAEALKKFEAATTFDGNFAMAYSKLAETYATLRHDSEAEDTSRRAVQIVEGSNSPERYLIQATHYRILHDTGKAIEAYEKLNKVSPDNADVQLILARLYEDSRETDQARGYYDKVLAHDPKNVDALLGMGRVSLLAGDAQGSLDYLNRAEALAMQFENEAQKGAALFFLGTSFAMLNKPADALRNFQESLDIRRRLDDNGGTAQTLNSMAQVQQSLGKQAESLKNYNEALRFRRQIGDKRGIANTLLDLGNLYESNGQFDQALELTKQSLQIQRDLGDPQNEATCLNNIGWFYLDKGDYENA
ncbi:MAG TPA: protein kinase, partial [Terriglobales bacterium]|nr:protein kinase [Terriglobales bacterium]